MSTVIGFLTAVQKDPELQAKFAAVAREAGFEISFEEYKAFLESMKNGCLADDELAAVAGGAPRFRPKNFLPRH